MIIKTHPKRAFSLIELLISLIVISCITAAFTPLITKKFATNIGFNGGGGTNIDSPSITTDCSSKYSSDCILCSSSECLSCVKSCPDGQCQDATNCSCKECPTSEFPNCAKFTSTACIQCQKGYRLVEGLCVACTSDKYSDNGKECKYCEAGYWPNSDSTSCVECPEGYICNNGIQVKCSGDTAPVIEEGVLGNNHVCAPCPSGLYCVDGVGKKCSEKFKDCAECDTNACTKCNEGTNLANGKCVQSMDDIIQINNLYVTKFNMGDKTSLPIPSSVTMLTAGSSADSCESGKCCWQGTTANASYCNANNGGYSGCTRTICNWAAAREICAKFDLNGLTWRLPISSELSKWLDYSLGLDVSGLQLCSDTTSKKNTYANCKTSSNCYGSNEKKCRAAMIWSNQKDNYSGGFYLYAYYLQDTSWNNDSNSAGYAQSVRCVAFVSDCPKGSYENGSICSECTSKYTHCASCTAAECKSCESGYELNPYNNKCYKVIEDAFPVDNLYVTRLNMGDGGLPIPASVSIIDTSTGASCTSGKCCWRNTTATVCQNKTSSENGGYSTCDRTVCNWYAADDICKSYSAGGKTWRLPNHTEAANWAVNTRTMGANGIQLCDSSIGISGSSDFAPKCGDRNSKCKGSGNCYPGYVWENSTTTTSASSGYLSNTSWRNTSRDKTYAQSVRCVTEIDYD